MKKMLAALLCAMMLTVAFAAYAEPVTLPDPAEQFNITAELGDTITLGETGLIDEISFTELIFAQYPDLTCGVIIAPTELYTGNMDDMDDAQIEELADLSVSDMDDPIWETRVLANGMKVIIAQEQGNYSMGTIFTIHDGFFIQCSYYLEADFAPLENNELEAILSFMATMNFIELAA